MSDSISLFPPISPYLSLPLPPSYPTTDTLSNLGILRILRLLRLLKLLRILRASRVIKRWKAYIQLSNAVQALFKYAFGICILTHWFACIMKLIMDMESDMEAVSLEESSALLDQDRMTWRIKAEYVTLSSSTIVWPGCEG